MNTTIENRQKNKPTAKFYILNFPTPEKNLKLHKTVSLYIHFKSKERPNLSGLFWTPVFVQTFQFSLVKFSKNLSKISRMCVKRWIALESGRKLFVLVLEAEAVWDPLLK